MKLPLEYRWLKANGFNGFVPWYLIDVPGEEWLRIEYQKETDEDFYPFARRQDRDDVAGFEIINGDIQSTIVSVHLTWSGKQEREGFPIHKSMLICLNGSKLKLYKIQKNGCLKKTLSISKKIHKYYHCCPVNSKRSGLIPSQFDTMSLLITC